MFFSDINECLAVNTNNCHPTKGICENIAGSFRCQCKKGYVGNGITCGGMLNLFNGKGFRRN